MTDEQHLEAFRAYRRKHPEWHLLQAVGNWTKERPAMTDEQRLEQIRCSAEIFNRGDLRFVLSQLDAARQQLADIQARLKIVPTPGEWHERREKLKAAEQREERLRKALTKLCGAIDGLWKPEYSYLKTCKQEAIAALADGAPAQEPKQSIVRCPMCQEFNWKCKCIEMPIKLPSPTADVEKP